MGTTSDVGRRPEPLLELGELDSLVDPHDELTIEHEAGGQLISSNGRDIEEGGGDVLPAS